MRNQNINIEVVVAEFSSVWSRMSVEINYKNEGNGGVFLLRKTVSVN